MHETIFISSIKILLLRPFNYHKIIFKMLQRNVSGEVQISIDKEIFSQVCKFVL
jgi:uncharacterized protein (DUF2249 family)